MEPRCIWRPRAGDTSSELTARVAREIIHEKKAREIASLTCHQDEERDGEDEAERQPPSSEPLRHGHGHATVWRQADAASGRSLRSPAEGGERREPGAGWTPPVANRARGRALARAGGVARASVDKSKCLLLVACLRRRAALAFA